jgi:hypothetical protein
MVLAPILLNGIVVLPSEFTNLLLAFRKIAARFQ